MHYVKLSWRVAYGAFLHFLADDGWAIASHIALSTLMALFPFMIVVTALAAFFFGSKDLADEAAHILLEAWPPQVAGPISADITGVLTNARGDVLTFGVLFAVYFASSGVESLRIGLNRAYNMAERRPWWLLRLESILYVLIGLALAIVLNARGARERGLGIALFAVQLVANLMWTPLFFGWHRVVLAFAVIVVMVVTSLATTLVFGRIRPAAAWLMVPYLVWICFAGALTWSIHQLNPDADGLVPGAVSTQIDL